MNQCQGLTDIHMYLKESDNLGTCREMHAGNLPKSFAWL